MKFPYLAIVLLTAACTSTTETSRSSPPRYATWVFADEKENAEDVRKRYLDGAFTMAQANGMEQMQAFTPGKALLGELKPDFIGVYAWPNAAAAQNMREGAVYLNDYKPLQKSGWDELVAVDVALAELPQWQFDADRYYTVALVWTKSEAAYKTYIDSTAGLRDDMDFEIVFSAPVATWSHLNLPADIRPPDRVAMLNWPDASVPGRYLDAINGPDYTAMVEATFERVYWHEIKPRQ